MLSPPGGKCEGQVGQLLHVLEGVEWALRKSGVEEELTKVGMTLYNKACTVVRIGTGDSDGF